MLEQDKEQADRLRQLVQEINELAFGMATRGLLSVFTLEPRYRMMGGVESPDHLNVRVSRPV